VKDIHGIESFAQILRIYFQGYTLLQMQRFLIASLAVLTLVKWNGVQGKEIGSEALPDDSFDEKLRFEKRPGGRQSTAIDEELHFDKRPGARHSPRDDDELHFDKRPGGRQMSQNDDPEMRAKRPGGRLIETAEGSLHRPRSARLERMEQPGFIDLVKRPGGRAASHREEAISVDKRPGGRDFHQGSALAKRPGGRRMGVDESVDKRGGARAFSKGDDIVDEIEKRPGARLLQRLIDDDDFDRVLYEKIKRLGGHKWRQNADDDA